jgi:hypothetical protein
MTTRELFPQASGTARQLLAAATGRLRSIKCGKPLRLLGLSIVMFGLLSSTVPLHAASNSDPTGTWIVEVSFGGADCSPGDVVLFSCSYALVTFHSDGTMAEVDTFASGAKQSWGPGVWQAAGKNSDNLYQFNTTFEQLQFRGSGSPSHYDFVWGSIALSSDGQTFTQSGWFASYEFDGSFITTPGYSGTFTAVGKRMPLLTQAPQQ